MRKPCAKEEVKTKWQAPCLQVTLVMSALRMIPQIRYRRLQRIIERSHIRGLQGLDNVA